jgi:hypothetical protein
MRLSNYRTNKTFRNKMTNEQYVEEIYHLAHNRGVLNEFREDVQTVKKTNNKLSLSDVVEIVECKYKLL